MDSRISGHTGLLALIGSPVGHSGSPAMYNYSFERLGLDFWAIQFFDFVFPCGVAHPVACAPS